MVVAVKRNVAGLVIVFVGAAMMQLATSGTYLRYVKPGMRWMLLAAGVVLIALAVTDVVVRSRQTHDHGLPRAAWLLLVPVFALLVVDPPALGADAAQRQSPVAAKPAKPVDPQGNAYWGDESHGPKPMTVRDYSVWAVWEKETMQGRSFQLTGFVTPGQERRLVRDPHRPDLLCRGRYGVHGRGPWSGRAAEEPMDHGDRQVGRADQARRR